MAKIGSFRKFSAAYTLAECACLSYVNGKKQKKQICEIKKFKRKACKQNKNSKKSVKNAAGNDGNGKGFTI